MAERRKNITISVGILPKPKQYKIYVLQRKEDGKSLRHSSRTTTLRLNVQPQHIKKVDSKKIKKTITENIKEKQCKNGKNIFKIYIINMTDKPNEYNDGIALETNINMNSLRKQLCNILTMNLIGVKN
jgi:hypothetical protein